MTLPPRKILFMDKLQRKSPRLPGFDYSSQQYYFVTICTHDKQCLFGSVGRLNCYGRIAQRALLEIPSHFPDVMIDQYVIMPNHIHAVLILGCGEKSVENKSDLRTVVGLYKSGVTRQIHKIDSNCTVWQRSFYDSVIRTDAMYQQISQYIANNPLKWQLDAYEVK